MSDILETMVFRIDPSYSTNRNLNNNQISV